MNNTFNINRFGLLVKRQWLDFGKIYLISLLVMTGVIVGFYGFNIPSPLKNNNFDYEGNLDVRFRYPLFLIVGFIFISIVASGYFSMFGQKSKAILELMTPASIFEKFLTGIFYTAVLSVFSYVLIFLVTDLLFIKYLNSNLALFKQPKGVAISAVLPITEFKDSNREVLNASLAIPFLVTSIFLLGSIYFNRFHYIKTAVSVMIFLGSAFYVIYKAVTFLTKDMVSNGERGFLNEKENALVIILLITSLLTLIIWSITFIRLKEKEV